MSEITICNEALAHIGDRAQVTSIRPPDGSQQAALCAKFYDTARDQLLEMANWTFATKRVKLAQVANPTLAIAQSVDLNATSGTWQYAYAYPSDVINALAVLPAEAGDDYEQRFGPVSDGFFPPYPEGFVPVPGPAIYTPQPYALETAGNAQIVLTNVCDAVLRYVFSQTDTTKFSAGFAAALSHLLASKLAGPIIKGDAGISAATGQLKLFEAFKSSAVTSDANQGKINVQPSPSWIRGR